MSDLFQQGTEQPHAETMPLHCTLPVQDSSFLFMNTTWATDLLMVVSTIKR